MWSASLRIKLTRLGHRFGEGRSKEETSAGSFHCAACNKWYKNASQLSNHEKSAKHKQAMGSRIRAHGRYALDLMNLAH